MLASGRSLVLTVRMAVIAALFLISPTVFGQSSFNPVILSFEGSVEVRRGDVQENIGGQANQPTKAIKVAASKIAVAVRERLFRGDTIITGGDGRIVLGLADGSQAVVAPKSVVKIEDLSASPRHLSEVLKGKTRVQIEKFGGRPNPYRVNTPTTVIAVRGTVFDVVVEEGQTEVFLHEGEVDVNSLNFPDQVKRLVPGEWARVRLFRPPLEPRLFSPGKNDRFFRMRSRSGFGGPIERSAGGRLAGAGLPSSRGEESRRSTEQLPGDPTTDSRGSRREPGGVAGRAGGTGESPRSTSRSRPGGRRL